MFLHRLKFASVAPLFTRRTRLFAPLLAAAALAGCGRYTHTKQCRALIAQVNPALDDVLTMTHGNESLTGSGSYVSAAGRYERLAKQLGPMEFGSEEMAQSVAEYAEILTSAAKDLRSIAAALDASNAPEAEKLNRELERLTGRERSVIGRMSAWCQP